MKITEDEINMLSFIGSKTNTFPLFIYTLDSSIIIVVDNEKPKILGKKGEKIRELERIFNKSIKVVDIKNDINEIIKTLFNKNEISKIDNNDGKIILYLKYNNKKIRKILYILKEIFTQFLNKDMKVYFVGGKYGKRRIRS